MKYFCFVFIFLATVSCKKDIYSDIAFEAPTFKDSVIVTPTVLNDTIFAKIIIGTNSYKDYLVLFANINDHLLHIFNKKDGRLVKSFAELGRGPQQILPFHHGYSINEKEGKLGIIYPIEKKIVIFHLDSILDNKEHFMDKIMYEDYDKIAWEKAYKRDKDFFMTGRKYETYQNGARFTLLSEKLKITDTYNSYPLLSSAKDSIKAALDWNILGILYAISPDGSKFAEATTIGGILETFSLSNKIERIALKGFYKPHFYRKKNEMVFTPKTQFGFYYLNASDDYLYALSYNGKQQKELSYEIQVFDWHGNPIKKYINKQYRLMSVCPDEKQGKLYALAYTDSHKIILVTFDM